MAANGRASGAWSIQSGLLEFWRTIVDIVGRLARHFFLFLVIYGSICLAIGGGFGTTYGVPYLFREDIAIDGYGYLELFKSAAFWSQFTATLLAGAVWHFAITLSAVETERIERMTFGRELVFFALRVMPTAFLALLALAKPMNSDIPPLGPGEIERAIIGMLGGLIVISGINIASRLIARVPGHFGLMQPVRIVDGDFEGLGGEHQAEPELRPAIWPRRYVHSVMFIGMLLTVLYQPRLIPATSIFVLASILVAIYVFFNLFSEKFRAVFIALAVAVIVKFAGVDYKYKFPGLDTYYANPVEFENGSGLKTQKSAAALTLPKVKPEQVQKATKQSGEIQQKMRSFNEAAAGQPADARPKFVVVTTSGGAYTATFWTAAVLDYLRAESRGDGRLIGFEPSIRLMTGASGGMVGAAYFAAMPKFFPKGTDDVSLVRMITDDIANANKVSESNPLGYAVWGERDSLTAITQQLAKGDVFDIVLPFQQKRDRGLALEEQWQKLDLTFKDLKVLEDEGKSPSLIFAPMLVETGQPMFISNLDLSQISTNEFGQTLNFFDAFPKAYDTFKVRTAARMSSTFPYVSPAVDLPTKPARRVVDAGYFDNFGINVAVAYLRQKQIVDLIKQYTSGVVFVEINAYPLDASEPDASTDPACKPSAIVGPNGKKPEGFEFLFSPLEALFAARNASMVFRNEQEYAALKQIYQQDGIKLDKVIFENKARSSFSWYLPKRDLDCINKQIQAPHNQAELQKLIGIWNGG